MHGHNDCNAHKFVKAGLSEVVIKLEHLLFEEDNNKNINNKIHGHPQHKTNLGDPSHMR